MVYFTILMLWSAAVTTAAYAWLSNRRQAVAMGQLLVRRADVSKLPSAWFKLWFPVLNLLAPFFQRFTLAAYREKMALELVRAGIGDAITVNHLLAMKALMALFLPIVLSKVFDIVSNPAVFLVVAALSYWLPDKLVADLRKAREKQIIRALPGAVDTLSLSVEAGLEFLIALQRLVERSLSGALRDELATVLSDIRLGTARSGALKSFAKRVEAPEVSSFVSVLVQADALGASIGPVLQQQAERMRVERFQRAEKEGAKASQKILFPLVLCIFPAVLIIVLGPVALLFIYGQQ
ncbi:MAG: type II secretion system F family protein [Vicinamibacterales bacterium]